MKCTGSPIFNIWGYPWFWFALSSYTLAPTLTLTPLYENLQMLQLHPLFSLNYAMSASSNTPMEEVTKLLASYLDHVNS